MEWQRQDVDQLIKLENEKMRLMLQEQGKQQMKVMIKRMEAQGRFLILQKDQEIAEASRRNMEVEALLQKMEMEKMMWQNAAKENDYMVEYLNNLLKQETEKNNNACCLEGDIEDAASCYGGEEEIPNDMVCRNCGYANTCVLFLPCRHLSSCRYCEAVVDSCPRCNVPKQG